MSPRIRFALFADPVEAQPAFDEMAAAVRGRAALQLEPVFVPSYAALAQAIEGGACDAAWSPPVLAHGLVAAGAGEPLVTVGRSGRSTYFGVLLARDGNTSFGATALSGGRIGWVSKLSAAGYAVPRLYLRSLGYDPNTLFGKQSFLGSHRRVMEALGAGEVDVGATYAALEAKTRMLLLPEFVPPGARAVLVAGPIPGDVVFAASHLEVKLRQALGGALLSMDIPSAGALARLMNVERFEVAAIDHFAIFQRWTVRAAESDRPPPFSQSRATHTPATGEEAGEEPSARLTAALSHRGHR